MTSTEMLHQPRFSRQQPHLQEPQRLSGIYQYHNAPEVLPEHGLEYDDNTYPVSDKYPVTSMDDYPASFHAQQYRDTNRPPGIIFGMKMRSFLLVALVFVLIVVGAVVGGTVGRNASHAASTQEALASDLSSPSSTTTSCQSSGGVRTIAASSPTTTSIKSATSTNPSTTTLATPTFTPLSACPFANNTVYISSTSNSSSLLSPSDNSTTTSSSTFTRYCDANTPATFKPLSSGFVYTFDDCIELCAAYNAYSGGSTTCDTAVYDVKQQRPVNCIIGNSNIAGLQELGLDGEMAVALMKPFT